MDKRLVNNASWILDIKDTNDLVASNVAQELKKVNEGIYFNDTTGEHFIFDFKCAGIWFECLGVDTVKRIIKLNAFK